MNMDKESPGFYLLWCLHNIMYEKSELVDKVFEGISWVFNTLENQKKS